MNYDYKYENLREEDRNGLIPAFKRSGNLNLAEIFNMETVAAICCPQVSNLSGGVESRHASSQRGTDGNRSEEPTHAEEKSVSGSSAPPAQNLQEPEPCPTCNGTEKVNEEHCPTCYEPAKDEEELDEQVGYGISLHRDFEREE